MDPADTIAAVEEATTTERRRLGSDKLLIALTGANLESEAVWHAMATREAGLAETVGGWAPEMAPEVAAPVERFAAAADDRRVRIDADPGGPDEFAAHLAAVTATPERIGAGLIAAPLVFDRCYLQVVSFFVNEADESSADVARDLRTGAGDLGPAEEALATLSDSDHERAREAAVEAIGVAYDEYANALEAMGLDPRPVC